MPTLAMNLPELPTDQQWEPIAKHPGRWLHISGKGSEDALLAKLAKLLVKGLGFEHGGPESTRKQ